MNGIVVVETSSGSAARPTGGGRQPLPWSRREVRRSSTSTPLQPAMDLLQPGAGTSNELWLAATLRHHERSLAASLGECRLRPSRRRPSRRQADRARHRSARGRDLADPHGLGVGGAGARRMRGDVRRGGRRQRRSAVAASARARTRARVVDWSRWWPASRSPQCSLRFRSV